MATLDYLRRLVRTVEPEIFSRCEIHARQRLARRDEDDWPILAVAIALSYPIWTEDKDFGCGAAIWTTDRIEFYLAEIDSETVTPRPKHS